MGWQPLPDDDHNQMVAAWLEVLEVSGVPVEHYDACYRAARQHQIEAKARGESVMALAAEDLAVEWVKIRAMNAEIDKTHLLAQNASGCCPKCGGTGWERMPDGSVRKGCAHDAEASEVASPEFVADTAGLMREALSKIGSPKPAPVVVEMKPRGRRLACTSCGREVSTLYGFETGQPCRELLNRGTHDGELKFCDGTLEARRLRRGKGGGTMSGDDKQRESGRVDADVRRRGWRK